MFFPESHNGPQIFTRIFEEGQRNGLGCVVTTCFRSVIPIQS